MDNRTITVLFVFIFLSWISQSYFAFKQVMDVQKKHKVLYSQYAKSCCVGYGHVKGKFMSGGCIVMLAVNKNFVVEDALVLKGISVLKRMKKEERLIGINIRQYAMTDDQASQKKVIEGLKNIGKRNKNKRSVEERALIAASRNIGSHINEKLNIA